MRTHLTKYQIAYIREQVRDGKKKSQVALEMGLNRETIYHHTKDITLRYRNKPVIHGETLKILQDLLKNGFVYTGTNRNRLRYLQRLFPMIKRSQYKNKSIYYLEDKNTVALKEMMRQNPTRILSFQDLGRMMKTFNTDIPKQEKRGFLGKTLRPRRYKIRKIRQTSKQVSMEKQTKIDDFLGRILHSDVLSW